MEPKWLGTSYEHPDNLPAGRFEKMGFTRERYEAMVRERSLRDQAAPKVGALAPDFEAERLTASGERGGTPFRLSAQRGRPVVLVFGSYT